MLKTSPLRSFSVRDFQQCERIVSSYNPLELWHLLSLDAPTVAVLWLEAAAHGAAVSVPAAEPCAMFLAVWVLYAADRLLDAAPLRIQGDIPELEARHLFHARHRKGFTAVLGIALVALAGLLTRFPLHELKHFAELVSVLALWLLLVHGAGSRRSNQLPKELAVGFFFPAAVFLPAFARATADRVELLCCALCFALVCTLNCMYVYRWEHSFSRSTGHITTRLGARHVVLLSCFALVCVFGTSWVVAYPESGVAFVSELLAPMAISVLLLLVFHAARHRTGSLRLRALADAALLTPILGLLWHSLMRG